MRTDNVMQFYDFAIMLDAITPDIDLQTDRKWIDNGV